MPEIITDGMGKKRNSDASSGSDASKKRKRQKMGNKSLAAQAALDFAKELQSGDFGLKVGEPPGVETPTRVGALALSNCEALPPRYDRGFLTPVVPNLEAPSTSQQLANSQVSSVKEKLAACPPSFPITQTTSKKRGRAAYGTTKNSSKSAAPAARKSLSSGKSIASLSFDPKNFPPSLSLASSSDDEPHPGDTDNLKSAIALQNNKIDGLTNLVHQLLKANQLLAETPPSPPPTTNFVPPDACETTLEPAAAPHSLFMPSGSTATCESTQLSRPPTNSSVGFSSGILAGEQLPDGHKTKIWADTFVDLYDVLYPDATSLYSVSFLNDDGKLAATPKKKRHLSQSEWSKAFDIFMSVYARKKSEEIHDLLSYSLHIKYLMDKGYNWQHYDIQFRKDREFTKCKWTLLRVDLLFLGNLLHASSGPFSQRNPSQTGKHPYGRTPSKTEAGSTPDVPPGYCFNYHSPGKFCSTQNCTFKHFCPICNSAHPKYKHNNGQANPRPQGRRSSNAPFNRPNPSSGPRPPPPAYSHQGGAPR